MMRAPRTPGRGPVSPPKKRLHGSRRPSALLLCVLLLNVAASGCKSDDGAAAGPRDASAPFVEIVPSRRGRIPLQERSTGIVRASNQVAVFPEIAGRVAEVLVRSGDQVTAGQPILRLDDSELQERLAQAGAAHASAQASLREASALQDEARSSADRTRRLADEGVVSRQEGESLDARLAAATASVDGARADVSEAAALRDERRAALARTTIRSPISGTIGRIASEVGSLVSSQQEIAVIGDLGSLIVDVPLTDGMLARLRPGQPARLTSPALAVPAEGVLARIPPFLEAGSFRTIAEIDVVGAPGLLPGMTVDVAVLHGESEEAILVPASASWEDPETGRLGVFVVGEPVGDGLEATRPARFHPIVIIGRDADMLAVTGIEEDDWTIVLGQHLLDPDETTQVRVRETSWERLLGLQRLQREDLLRSFLAEQQRIAMTGQATPPTVDEMRESAAKAPGTGAPAAGASAN